jgi:hypothetical protein
MGSEGEKRAAKNEIEIADYPLAGLRDLAKIPYIGRLAPFFVHAIIPFGAILVFLSLVTAPGQSAAENGSIISFSFLFLGGGIIIRGATRRNARLRRERLAQLRADSLPERASRAAQVLQEAITLVTELQDELNARTALLDDVKRQVAETTERAADIEKLSHVDEETTLILNKYFDEALKGRLETLERSARGREWLIGTVVALIVGVGAILVSHYGLGF